MAPSRIWVIGGVPAPDRKVVGRHDTLADKSLMRREAQERVRRLGEIWTGPATESNFCLGPYDRKYARPA